MDERYTTEELTEAELLELLESAPDSIVGVRDTKTGKLIAYARRGVDADYTAQCLNDAK